MKQVLIIFTVLFSSTIWARMNLDYSYIGVGGSYSKLTSESETLNNLDAASGINFHYGKRFGKYFAAELGYNQATFKEELPDPNPYPSSFKSELSLMEVSLGYQIIVNRYWAFKMGYTYAHLKRDYVDDGLTDPQKELINYDKTFHTYHFGMVGNMQLFWNVGLYFQGMYSSTDAYNKVSGSAGIEIRY